MSLESVKSGLGNIWRLDIVFRDACGSLKLSFRSEGAAQEAAALLGESMLPGGIDTVTATDHFGSRVTVDPHMIVALAVNDTKQDLVMQMEVNVLQQRAQQKLAEEMQPRILPAGNIPGLRN